MIRGLEFGSRIDDLLERLYARNGSLDWNQFDGRTNEFLRGKLIALDRSKAEFCYQTTFGRRGRRPTTGSVQS